MAFATAVLSSGSFRGEILLIFLTVGTWRNGYDRLVKAVDELLERQVVAETVVAQVGHGSYQPRHMKALEFCSPGEFAQFMAEADLVISHAGMGTIAQALQRDKPVVVLPRKCALGEVDSDHQFDTAAQLETEGKILVAYETDDLAAKLEQAKGFVPKRSETTDGILRTVGAFVDDLAAAKEGSIREKRSFLRRLWPYEILTTDDGGLRADLGRVMDYFQRRQRRFDTVVFIPKAGVYLSELFTDVCDHPYEVRFVTVRRASTVAREGCFKRFVFRHRRLSDVMRHVEVMARLLKYKLGIGQKMVAMAEIPFDVTNKSVLVIDDSVDTGSTLRTVERLLRQSGAASVTTACITNHLMPDKIHVDFAVHRYKLLRTKNSRDYHAE